MLSFAAGWPSGFAAEGSVENAGRWGETSMKFHASLAALLLALTTPALAQTLDDLKNDGKNTDNVLTYGMGYHQHRYSALKQIDKSNIKRLVPVWNLSLDN